MLLPDVNVLIALAWPNHPFHELATQRMSNDSEDWATCALTQLGFIRLSTNPLLVKQEFSPGYVVALLSALTAHDHHHYLADHPAPAALDTQVVFNPLSGTKQVTDAYLLAFARYHQATLLTLDVKMRALATGSGELEVLSATNY